MPDPGGDGVKFTAADRKYVRYCLRYAVLVLGKKGVADYVATLDRKGNVACGTTCSSHSRSSAS